MLHPNDPSSWDYRLDPPEPYEEQEEDPWCPGKYDTVEEKEQDRGTSHE